MITDNVNMESDSAYGAQLLGTRERKKNFIKKVIIISAIAAVVILALGLGLGLGLKKKKEKKVYEIDSCEGLSSMDSGDYTLTQSIDCKGMKADFSNFEGNFDGNGYSIKNLIRDCSYGYTETYVCGGVFGEVKGTIKNLVLEDMQITGTVHEITDELIVGGLAAQIEGAVDNIQLKNGNINLALHNVKTAIVGGLIGTAIDSNFGNSFLNLTISVLSSDDSEIDESVGGLVGTSEKKIYLENIVTAGSIKTYVSSAGGLIGLALGPFYVIDCSSTMAMTGLSMGGFVGQFSPSFSSSDSDISLLIGQITKSHYYGDMVRIDNNTDVDYGIGGLVGEATKSQHINVMNSYSKGSISSATNYLGGLVGVSQGDIALTGAFSNMSISGGYFLGGLVGSAVKVTSTASAFYGPKINGAGGIGGIVGHAQTFTCYDSNYTNAQITGTDHLGGILGYGQDVIIENATFSGSIIGDDYLGGIVGSASVIDIVNASFSGSVISYTDEGYSFGGMVGLILGNGTLQNCSTTSAKINTYLAHYLGGLVGRCEENLDVKNSSVHMDITGVSRMGGIAGSVMNNLTVSYCEYNGSMIAKSDQLSQEGYAGGIVGFVSNASISDSYSVGSYSTTYKLTHVGGIVGKAINALVQYSYSEMNIKANSYIGGLVGFTDENATILESYYEGDIVESTTLKPPLVNEFMLGGLLGGSDYYAHIEMSYARGKIDSNGTSVGGVAGEFIQGTIKDSYAIVDITGIDELGGLLGFPSQHVQIYNCYSAGLVKNLSDSNSAGGLIGFYSDVTYKPQISSCYWDTQTSGQSTSNGGTGLTTSQMGDKSNYDGWNFLNIWEFVMGSDYPIFKPHIGPE